MTRFRHPNSISSFLGHVQLLQNVIKIPLQFSAKRTNRQTTVCFCGKRTFSVYGANLWNQLPPKVWVVGKLSQNFVLVGICSSKALNLWLKPAVLGKIKGKCKISSTHKLICRKNCKFLATPWSATLSWWWGLCTDDPDDFSFEGEELTKRRPPDRNNHTTRHQSQVAVDLFGFTADHCDLLVTSGLRIGPN